MKMTYNDDKNGGYVAKLKYVDINQLRNKLYLLTNEWISICQ